MPSIRIHNNDIGGCLMVKRWNTLPLIFRDKNETEKDANVSWKKGTKTEISDVAKKQKSYFKIQR
jgi:hypothetical protein